MRSGRVALLLLATAAAALAAGAGPATPAAARPAKAPPALLAAIPSPADPSLQARGTFVGAVRDSEAYIAILVRAGKAVVYLCDGEALDAWLGGALGAGGRFDFRGAPGVRVTGRVRSGRVTGQVTVNGRRLGAFTALPARAGERGLYRFHIPPAALEPAFAGESITLGWIQRGQGLRGILRRADGTVLVALRIHDPNGFRVGLAPSAEGPRRVPQGECVDCVPGGSVLSCDLLFSLLASYDRILQPGKLRDPNGIVAQEALRLKGQVFRQLVFNGCL